MAGIRCPLCDVPMREVLRRGVRIDVCPECRGVWLDRGELDRLLADADREVDWPEEVPGPAERTDPRRAPDHRKKKWWRELFDFELFD